MSLSTMRVAVATAALITVAQADLPVHCVRSKVAGDWTFKLGPLSEKRTTCGHRRPDDELTQPELSSLHVEREITVSLAQPATAHSSALGDGKWTMVYDEGFSAEFAGESFFAFNKYVLSNPASLDYFPNTAHGHRVYRSLCGQTELGWYQDKATKKYGCFYATKTSASEASKHEDHLALIALPSAPAVRMPAVEQLTQAAFVAHLNAAAGGSWSAKVYDNMKGLSLAELNLKAGRQRYTVLEQERRRPLALISRHTQVEIHHDKASMPSVEDQAAIAKLPTSWDWRNVDGVSYVDPPMDQGDCGSCYALSSTVMMSARYRVMKKNPKLPPFSITFPLYCSEFNQGCKGGYPYLMSMWSKDVGLIPETCMGNYFASDSMTCPNFMDKHKTNLATCMKKEGSARVKEFGYVGGYYGGCSELTMMQELHANGPIAVALEPQKDFMYYDKGVYKHVDVALDRDWVKVDHAVLLVGWGEDKGDKYWIMQNSWGKGWGEGGFMRIARGGDESGVEFQAVFATLEDATPEDILNSL